MSGWLAQETSKHQDHVIAHVIGTSVLGYFVREEALYVLLDIGFIWTIYLDGQMVLLPASPAIKELNVTSEEQRQLIHEIELLERDGREAVGVTLITSSPVECLIREVSLFVCDDRRKILLEGESADLVIHTSLTTGEIDLSNGFAA